MIKGTKYSAHLFLHAIFGEEVTKEKKDTLPETNSSPMKNPPPFLGFIPLKWWIFMGYVLLVYQRVSFFISPNRFPQGFSGFSVAGGLGA